MEFHFLLVLYQFIPLCVGLTIKVLNITFHYCSYCAKIYILKAIYGKDLLCSWNISQSIKIEIFQEYSAFIDLLQETR